MNPFGHICAVAVVATTAFACVGTATAQNQEVVPDPAGTQPSRPPTDLRAEPVPPAVDATFKAWDSNHDGSLTLPEFRNGWRNLRRGSRQTAGAGGAGLRQQFDRIDADNNGGIDRDEYPNLMLVKRAGVQAPPFSEVDRNHDQKLDFAEYSALVRRLRTTRTPATPPTK